MKEYKLIKKGVFQKDKVLIDELNQLAREGWVVKSAVGSGHGDIAKVILERDKYR
jgi:hypothetical protein